GPRADSGRPAAARSPGPPTHQVRPGATPRLRHSPTLSSPLVYDPQGQQGVMRGESSREREEECQGSRRHPFRHQLRPPPREREGSRTHFVLLCVLAMHLLEKRRPISEVPVRQKILAFAPSASEHQNPPTKKATKIRVAKRNGSPA